MQGNYHGVAPYLITPLMGLQKYSTCSYALGCSSVYSNDTSGFAQATVLARQADGVVLVVGNTVDKANPYRETEAWDRNFLTFPGVQEELIAQVAAASSKPIVVVVVAGGCIDLSLAKANPKVGAILWSGYAGQSSGDAIAMTLFGDNNPSGRLTQTFYPQSYVEGISMFDMNLRADSSKVCCRSAIPCDALHVDVNHR
jgi:beta-D-xylosidase 4